MTETIGRPITTAPEGPVPPQAPEAERAVLAAMLLDHETIGRALELLETGAFYRVAHQKIFDAVLGLYNKSERADLITVSEELRKKGELEAVGGPTAISQILDLATTSTNLEEHARIVASKAVLRLLIRAAQEIQQESYAAADDTAAILDRAEQRIFAITDRRVRQGFISLRELLKPAFEHIHTLYERKTHVTGVPSGYDDLDRLTAGFQSGDLVIIAGRPSMGKCVTGDTLIDDPHTGARRSIEEYVREQVPCVVGISSKGQLRPTPVGEWIDSGVQPCYRLVTRTGRSVNVTGHHPFLTCRGWRPLHDLCTGDQIAVPRALEVFGSDRSWSLARVRLLAYLIAEGGLTEACPMFTNTDPALVDDFHAVLAGEFPDCEGYLTQDGITWRIRRKRPCSNRPIGVRLNPVTRWLDELGLMGKHSRVKRLPDCVWTWPRANLVEFFRTLFSCDGTIYAIRGFPRIEYTIASEALARDAHHALTRLGVVAKLWRKAERVWRVEITDPEAVDRYQQEVGWAGEKRSRFAHFDPMEQSNYRKPSRGFPATEAWDLVRSVARGQGLTMADLHRQAGSEVRRGFNPHVRRGLPRRRLERLADVLNRDELRLLASPDLYWDEIVSIESIGEHQVYDLSVPDGANFVANDICLHNTSLAINIAENAAIRYSVPCAIFSLEMSKEQLVMRLLCSQSEVPLHKVRSGYLSQQDWPRLTTGAGLLTQAPIMLDDSAAPTVLEIRAKCRRLKSEGKLGLVVIDYLQLIRGLGSVENRVQEISQITRALKGLAKELSVPIIALSQLSRAVEQRGSERRPQLSDLRDSGSIEQDADVVMFVYREEYYKPDDPSLKGKATIILAKQRNGPTADLDLTFLREFTKFVPYSPLMPGETEPDF